jgi:membrane-associated phospholipid phosphatase
VDIAFGFLFLLDFLRTVAVCDCLVWHPRHSTDSRCVVHPLGDQSKPPQLRFPKIILVLVGVSEYGLKRINQQHRPEGSCVTSCGMPSSHAAIAIGLLIVIVGNGAIFGFHTDQDREKQTERSWWSRVWNTIVYPEVGAFDGASQGFILFLGLWFALLLPIPFSRVILHDHSPSQAMMGSLVGLVGGCIWLALSHLVRRHWSGESQIWGVFPHNMPPIRDNP